MTNEVEYKEEQLELPLEDTQIELINTADLQLFSVQQFMQKLNYLLFRTDKNGLVFLSTEEGKTPFRVIGLSTAIRMHNSQWMDMQNGSATCTIDGVGYTRDIYTIIQAQSARVVQKCKGQYNKKAKTFVLTHENANWVKFIHPEYSKLFL